MLLNLVSIFIMLGGKYHQESAKNGISECLDFKVFGRTMPPDALKTSHNHHFRNCLNSQKRLPTALLRQCISECNTIE